MFYRFLLFIGSFVLIWAYISGLLSDIIDVDAAQYAAISMEMLKTHSFLEVMERGKDYLDKPPFLFWVNSLSFKLLGFNNLAYKLPTFLFSLGSIYYTYRLGQLLYGRRVGRIAGLILATSIGFFWINNDVKTDGLLMSAMVFSIFQLIQFIQKKEISFLLAASIGMGIGMLTKGPMGFVFPMAVVGFHLMMKKKLIKEFSLVRLALMLLIIGLLLSPMLMGLYGQFDMHPEKMVNGKLGVSGLKFFFWEQSFGRITGGNVWKNNTSFLYLFHSLLMLVFPYSILTIVAYVRKIKKAVQKDYQGEYFTIGSMVILMALSLSSYKIPHYVVVIFPLVAILVASELVALQKNGVPKWLKIHHWAISGLVLAFAVVSFYIFDYHVVILGFGIFLMALMVNLLIRKKYMLTLYFSAIFLGFIFNVQLLSGMQNYFVGRRAADMIRAKGIQDEPIYFFNRDSQSMEFYLRKRMKQLSWEALLENIKTEENAWYFMSLDGKEALVNHGLFVEDELSLLQYDINRVDFLFLNPTTRTQSLDPRFLIRFKPPTNSQRHGGNQ